jgi:hypothetical protein
MAHDHVERERVVVEVRQVQRRAPLRTKGRHTEQQFVHLFDQFIQKSSIYSTEFYASI